MTDAITSPNRQHDDSRLAMLKAQKGDRHAFDTVAGDYANMVIALAYRMLGSREDALDCAQDAFVRAWENVRRYNPKWSVATWLRRITTNLALDRLRRRKILTHFPEGLAEETPDTAESPLDVVERKERADVVYEVLDMLPEKYRLVLVLREMEGMDIADIAQATDTQAATVRWRLHRARALFRERWQTVALGE